MTAFQSQEIQNEASKYNIIAYLNKSTPTEEIVKTIEEALKNCGGQNETDINLRG